MIKRALYVVASIAFCSVLTAQTATAASITFDDNAGLQNGTLTGTAGIGGTVTGAGIDFYSVNGVGTPTNAGVVLSCDNPTTLLTQESCEMTFVTGGWNASGEYGPGGNVTVSGTLYNGLIVVATGVLASGSWSVADNVGGTTFAGAGSDQKNAALIAFYGLGQGFTFSDTNIAIDDGIVGGAAFTANVTNADFDNRSTPTAVPEPASVLLLGTGLLGVGRTVRRRMRKV